MVRGDPYVVLSRLGKHLGTTLAPDEVLPVIVETVAHSLKLPHVAITLRQGGAFKTVASHGSSEKSLMHLPLVYQTETIGELVLASHVSEPFTKREMQLLHELARQAGVAIHTVLLNAEIERSRQHIVESREQARRKLGNDLHDRVAPAFTAILRKVEMVSTSLEQDLAVTHQHLEEIRQQVKDANSDIRHLVYQLHPPELQHYGLVQALREHIQGYDQPHSDALHITMEAPQEPLLLSIAVESATYYIALAALNNVYRHARAQTCHLRLELIHNAKSVHPIPGVWNTAILELEINDDGCGLPTREEKNMPGLGLLSMQERAAELGGTCVVETKVTGGTRVYTCVPCMPVINA